MSTGSTQLSLSYTTVISVSAPVSSQCLTQGHSSTQLSLVGTSQHTANTSGVHRTFQHTAITHSYITHSAHLLATTQLTAPEITQLSHLTQSQLHPHRDPLSEIILYKLSNHNDKVLLHNGITISSTHISRDKIQLS